ncbi:hypothetical protein A5739_08790 [Mycobacterium colombiense]|uniref:AbiTii domain-containing protein n=1 Tax=Mycobacterium colombiense TaxID=339268 RepID=UPI00096C1DEA|nr:hypothetical protein [Mycobacterium colombiense]OMC33427.1 hypothetical protein A5739_08790 [Mycobacterium colombiense]
MSKLSDIIDAATTDTVSLAALLRMTKVLAARTDTPPLIDWVDNELGGYPSDAIIPEYRGPFPTQVLTHWSGPFGAEVKNLPYPSTALPEDMRQAGFDYTFYQAVSELERLAATQEILRAPWSAESVAILNQMMDSGYITSGVPMHGLVGAYQQITPALIVSVLDQVRTRVLSFALELEKTAPHAGEPGAAVADASVVTHIVNTHIYGHGNVVAIDSPGAQQLGGVKVDDLESLLTAVAGLGFSPQDVAELREAIEDDKADQTTPQGKPGSRVAQFLGKVTLGTLKTAGQTGIQELAKAVGKMVMAYYGIT